MNNGYLSLAGLVLLAPICLMLMSGTLGADDAARRALALVIVLAAVDRIVLPMGRVVLQFLAVREPDEED